MIYLNNILFIDIETVSLTKEYNELPERLKTHWDLKSARLNENEPSDSMYFEKAAIYAEFGKVLCIGIGGFSKGILRVKTLYNESEELLLQEFSDVLESHPAGKNLILCAHNGKEFDFPYLCRRMLINGIKLPKILNISAKKPWQINHLDTLEMWKFGDYKNYTSLDLLASVFDIPGSKSIMKGSDVNAEFYENGNLEKISEYCREDVVVLTQLYLKLIGEQSLEESKIMRV